LEVEEEKTLLLGLYQKINQLKKYMFVPAMVGLPTLKNVFA
jgi:hypothetical protein